MGWQWWLSGGQKVSTTAPTRVSYWLVREGMVVDYLPVTLSSEPWLSIINNRHLGYQREQKRCTNSWKKEEEEEEDNPLRPGRVHLGFSSIHKRSSAAKTKKRLRIHFPKKWSTEDVMERKNTPEKQRWLVPRYSGQLLWQKTCFLSSLLLFLWYDSSPRE